MKDVDGIFGISGGSIVSAWACFGIEVPNTIDMLGNASNYTEALGIINGFLGPLSLLGAALNMANPGDERVSFKESSDDDPLGDLPPDVLEEIKVCALFVEVLCFCAKRI